MKKTLILCLLFLASCSQNNSPLTYSDQDLSVPSELGSSSSYSFGTDLQVNKSVADKTFTFSRVTGSSEAAGSTVALSSSADFSVVSATGCNRQLVKSSDKCYVKVRFLKYKVVGSYSAILNVGSDGANNSITISATVVSPTPPVVSPAPGGNPGGGSQPTYSLSLMEGTVASLNPVNYGDVDKNRTLSKTFTLKNTGENTAPLAVALTGSGYTMSNNTCTTSLLKAKSCYFKITFSSGPGALVDEVKNANLVINSDISYGLTATVKGNPLGTPDLKFFENGLEVTSLNIGSIIQDSSIQKVITITNQGNGSITATAAISSNDASYVIASSNCSKIDPSKNCQVRISFTGYNVPAGQKTGSLSLGSFSLSLSGMVTPKNPVPLVAPNMLVHVIKSDASTYNGRAYLSANPDYYMKTGSFAVSGGVAPYTFSIDGAFGFPNTAPYSPWNGVSTNLLTFFGGPIYSTIYFHSTTGQFILRIHPEQVGEDSEVPVTVTDALNNSVTFNFKLKVENRLPVLSFSENGEPVSELKMGYATQSETKSRTITVSNSGDAPYDGSVVLDPSNSSLSIASSNCSHISAGGSCSVTLSLTGVGQSQGAKDSVLKLGSFALSIKAGVLPANYAPLAVSDMEITVDKGNASSYDGIVSMPANPSFYMKTGYLNISNGVQPYNVVIPGGFGFPNLAPYAPYNGITATNLSFFAAYNTSIYYTPTGTGFILRISEFLEPGVYDLPITVNDLTEVPQTFNLRLRLENRVPLLTFYSGEEAVSSLKMGYVSQSQTITKTLNITNTGDGAFSGSVTLDPSNSALSILSSNCANIPSGGNCAVTLRLTGVSQSAGVKDSVLKLGSFSLPVKAGVLPANYSPLVAEDMDVLFDKTDPGTYDGIVSQPANPSFYMKTGQLSISAGVEPYNISVPGGFSFPNLAPYAPYNGVTATNLSFFAAYNTSIYYTPTATGYILRISEFLEPGQYPITITVTDPTEVTRTFILNLIVF